MALSLALVCLFLSLSGALALDNGLARTPPMGWLAWERFRCDLDCKMDPDNCISENLFLDMGKRLYEDGWQQLGYDRVNIDDCWPLHERDTQGNLVADPDRFPHGIKWLADKMHNMSLKLGIYGDYGTKTCGGYPGMMGYIRQDAQLFASWGIDSYKLDGCYSDVKLMNDGYAEVTWALNQTGRQILYSCSWPDYQRIAGMTVDYPNIAKHCNLWRNYNDIQDSWASVSSIIDYYGDPKNYATFGLVNGPGQWNDPDMLIVGDFSLSYDQSKAQFAFWCLFSAPLLMSNDLRKISTQAVEILQNKELIAVNQDPLGRMASRVVKSGSEEVWAKPLHNGDIAVILWNRSTGGMHLNVTVNFEQVGFHAGAKVSVRDMYAGSDLGAFVGSYSAFVNPSGGVVALRLSLSFTAAKNVY